MTRLSFTQRSYLRIPFGKVDASYVALIVVIIGIIFGEPQAFSQQPVSFATLQDQFSSIQKPLVNEFCLGCHSTTENQGELDLQQFRSVDDIRGNVTPWLRVLEMLDDGEMPPKDAKRQPTKQELQSIRSWVRTLLDAVAISNSGDPGPVVLRRLNNAEYTYSIQDLTGVRLQPASEFPSDSAAGEGFTNVGSALVISPALIQKYLNSAKEISKHAILLPTGIQFSEHTTQRDWTNEKLVAIQKFYARFTDSGGATAVNLQGLQFDTNSGGRLPLEKYLNVSLLEREALLSRTKTIEMAALEHGLNERYFRVLWDTLNEKTPSLVLDIVRTKWRMAKPNEFNDLVATILQWQKSLWRFATIGHIGKRNGPSAWQVPIHPLAASHEIRIKLPQPKDGKNISMYLFTSDLGDGNQNDFAVWENPRFVAPDKPDLLLRDLRTATALLSAKRKEVLSKAAACLTAATEFRMSTEKEAIETLAQKHSVDPSVLASWFQYLGIGTGATRIDSYLTKKMERAENYDFIQGWVGADALSVIANSSDQFVRVPGDMQPHSICVHPSPKQRVSVGWQSPITGNIKISGRVQRAHIGCGNGVTWNLEHVQGNSRRVLASGAATNADAQKIAPVAEVLVSKGDLISLSIGPRNGEHSCDTTAIDLTIQNNTTALLEWDLAKDVSPDILGSNPHSDRLGNASVWHFYSEPDSSTSKSVIPTGSLLEKWQSQMDIGEKQRLAMEVQSLLDRNPESIPGDSPDAALHAQLTSLSGPLFSHVRTELLANKSPAVHSNDSEFGLDPSLFGLQPNGQPLNAANIAVQAPSILEILVPADFVEGYEFVATGSLHPESGAEGTVQIQVLFDRPSQLHGLAASSSAVKGDKSTWSDGDKPLKYDAPIIVADDSRSRQRLLSQFDAFRQLFPAALCYTKIVPVDEVVTLTLYYREDEQLKRLMLNDEQAAELDKLWDELHFVSQDALLLVDAYEQLWQFATQDADPSAFTPMRDGIMQRAEQFRIRMLDAEPIHLLSVLGLAERSWRRQLSSLEKLQLRELYAKLRSEELPHDAAIRLLLSRVLVAPAFLYRGEEVANGKAAGLVSANELATRLSYFLWSTLPDLELQEAASNGRLHNPDVLRSQVRRMMSDMRMRRMAIEFGCQWLHIREFDLLDEKSLQHFPEFAELKSDMYEEAIRFFESMFRTDGSVLDLLNANHTFANGRLAKFYGLPNDEDNWHRIDGTREFSRGGILSMAATMSKHSGASRTSPILRGNWVSEFLLGEKLPRPPQGVPVLPEDVPVELTERELIERHSQEPACAKCHQRIDGFGFALEQYDTIGRLRIQDTHGHKIDTAGVLRDGTQVVGVEGLREYLSKNRRDDFLRTFCMRLLGYALGRSVQLSDKPLMDEMIKQLNANDFRISVAIELIVMSPQFKMIRGAEHQP